MTEASTIISSLGCGAAHRATTGASNPFVRPTAAWQGRPGRRADGPTPRSAAPGGSPAGRPGGAEAIAIDFQSRASAGRDSPYPVIARCLAWGRMPTAAQIELVAERIWRDWSGPDRPSWSDLDPGGAECLRMRRAARSALGL
jgi:hypothetical protein